MDTSRVLWFYLICYGLCLPKVVSLLVFWSLHVSMCELTEAIFSCNRSIITAHHQVFVSSQYQRDKMAEERPQTSLIPLSSAIWDAVKHFKGGPGFNTTLVFEENYFLLCCTQRFTLPPSNTPLPFLMSKGSLFLTDGPATGSEASLSPLSGD